MLRYVLLAVMSEAGPLHGYALMKAFAARSGIVLSVGNVYRELQRLRADGHIEPTETPADADPRRVPYKMTDAGRTALASWFATPAEAFLREPIDPLYCRLSLLASSKATHAVKFLDDLEVELSQQRRSADRRRETARDGSPLLDILLGRRSRHLAADMEMIAEMRTAVAALSPSHPASPDRHPPRRDRRVGKAESRRVVARVGR